MTIYANQIGPLLRLAGRPDLANRIRERETVNEDCTDPGCTRLDGQCIGYHCPRCGKPCGSHGHGC